MTFLIITTCVLSVFNFLLLVSIAALLAKVVNYLGGGEEKEGGNAAPMPSRERRLLDLPTRPNYVDMLAREPQFDGVGDALNAE